LSYRAFLLLLYFSETLLATKFLFVTNFNDGILGQESTAAILVDRAWDF